MERCIREQPRRKAIDDISGRSIVRRIVRVLALNTAR